MADINSSYSTSKIIWHPEKLQSFLKEEVVAPIYVRFKPTNRCNHRCFYCSYEPDFGDIRRVSRKDEIPREKLMEIVSDFKNIGVKAVTYSGGGEPLVHPNISEVLEKTLDYGIDLSMITNGQKLNGKNAELLGQGKWVRISSDSYTAKLFSETRRVPEDLFYELKNNIQNFARTKSPKCVLGINFVVQEKNAPHVYDSIKFFRELGVNNVKVTPEHIPKGFIEYHAPFKDSVIEQVAKARLDFPEFGIHDTYEADFKLTESNKRTYSKCYVMQTIPTIGADSVVYFCHDKAYSENGILGSIKERSFANLWFSKEAAEIFRTFNPEKECRHHCANDRRNIEINNILGIYSNHVNFI